MAISTFIPTIWEARLLAHLDKASGIWQPLQQRL